MVFQLSMETTFSQYYLVLFILQLYIYISFSILFVQNISTCTLINLLILFTGLHEHLQVEVHPYCRQNKLREFCKEKGIQLCAYSPLGGKGTPWSNNAVMDCPLLKQIAMERGKTIAQVNRTLQYMSIFYMCYDKLSFQLCNYIQRPQQEKQKAKLVCLMADKMIHETYGNNCSGEYYIYLCCIVQ